MIDGTVVIIRGEAVPQMVLDRYDLDAPEPMEARRRPAEVELWPASDPTAMETYTRLYVNLASELEALG